MTNFLGVLLCETIVVNEMKAYILLFSTIFLVQISFIPRVICQEDIVPNEEGTTTETALKEGVREAKTLPDDGQDTITTPNSLPHTTTILIAGVEYDDYDEAAGDVIKKNKDTQASEESKVQESNKTNETKTTEEAAKTPDEVKDEVKETKDEGKVENVPKPSEGEPKDGPGIKETSTDATDESKESTVPSEGTQQSIPDPKPSPKPTIIQILAPTQSSQDSKSNDPVTTELDEVSEGGSEVGDDGNGDSNEDVTEESVTESGVECFSSTLDWQANLRRRIVQTQNNVRFLLASEMGRSLNEQRRMLMKGLKSLTLLKTVVNLAGTPSADDSEAELEAEKKDDATTTISPTTTTSTVERDQQAMILTLFRSEKHFNRIGMVIYQRKNWNREECCFEKIKTVCGEKKENIGL